MGFIIVSTTNLEFWIDGYNYYNTYIYNKRLKTLLFISIKIYFSLVKGKESGWEKKS